MARDGSGNYSLPEAAFVYDTVIDETAVNNNFSDIATALTGSLAKNGETTPTANLPMGGYRHTGVGNSSARNHYAATGQVQDAAFIWCGTAGGTKNALTLTPSPAISAYTTGQYFIFKAGSTQSDDAVTIAVSGLTTKAGEIDDTALSATLYIEANKYYLAQYDGTAFQLTRLSFDKDEHASPTTTRGDIIRRGASADERLALGADNTLLTSDGTDAGWETLTSLLDAALSSTQGVVLYRGASAWAALAVGSAKQVLTSGGAAANPSWGDAPVLLGTFTASAAASLDITGVFSSTYKRYEIVVTNIVPADDDKDLYLRASVSSSFQSNATDYGWIINSGRDNGSDTNTAGNRADTSAAQIALNDTTPSGLGTGTNEKGFAVINVWDPAAGNVVMFDWRLIMRSADGGNLHISDGTGHYKGSTSAVDGVQLLMESAGNISAVAKVYGYP